ncbi:hypothetical protein A2757_01410 [Candidatus Giovannonibacteria bacterium RIFCSPHIGHO2_01_FULL_48_47]|nr:MAG: hypothetical protein A2757_01410 [Candidatus Giovannonibacteria bacterium RIFCSPHIGHO2_01_FULL_48_47]OGF68385.1 MAG: hypothetical protein A3D61_00700 [Candidatus Giovannonibacteria bacterium RIFCSPHIGHO2_02_FULL_48_15]OGF89687.1 MAG: hypothetical protein A3B26_01535 [Candidatus Giovannonibacteria bacterium RIFCSPLOWO2_01_FULL_48_47]
MNLLMWIFPIISGLFEAFNRNVIKITKIHNFLLLSGGYLTALPFYLVWLYLEGFPEVHPDFWWAVSWHVPLWTLAMILTVEAHRSSPLILTAPYLALTPAFLLIISPWMGGGTPTPLGVGGVLLITAGVYLLNTKEGKVEIFEPFARLYRERGSRLMLLVAIIAAVTSNLDYTALVNANAPFYLLIDHGLIALVTIALAGIYFGLDRINREELQSNSPWPFVLFGISIAGASAAFILALKFIENVPYAVAGKRAGMILATVGSGLLLGSFRAFRGQYSREKEDLRYRLPGTALVVSGMIIVILWGGAF